MASTDRINKSTDAEAAAIDTIQVRPKASRHNDQSPSSSSSGARNTANLGQDAPKHGATEVIDMGSDGKQNEVAEDRRARRITFMSKLKTKRRGWFAYVRTRDFWIVLVLGLIILLYHQAMLLTTPGKYFPCALPRPTPSLASSPPRELRFPPSNPSSITFSSTWSIPRLQFTATVSRSGEDCCLRTAGATSSLHLWTWKGITLRCLHTGTSRG